MRAFAVASSLVLIATSARGQATLAVGRPAAGHLAWPERPEEPRIRHAGWLRSEADVGKRASGASFFRQAVTGAKASIIAVTRPHDVWVDSRNRMYVVDAGRRKLLRFDAAKKSAVELGDKGEGRIVKPMGIAGTPDGTVYVADQSAKRVVALGPDGEFVRAFGGVSVLLNPVDVAVDAQAHRVYVADSYLHQILVFDQRDGRLLQRLGRTAATIESAREANAVAPRAHGADGGAAPRLSPRDTAGAGILGHPSGYSPEPRDVVENRGSKTGEFRFPSFVYVGPGGQLAVSDALNFRVQLFDRGGRYLRSVGAQGSGPGQFARPKGVALDEQGHVYVADAAFSNVQVFDTGGRLLIAFARLGNGDGDLWMPEGIYIDAASRVYVSDRFNNRIQIYQVLRPSASTGEGPAR